MLLMDQAPDELSNASEQDVQDLSDTPLDQLPENDENPQESEGEGEGS
jgi:hypothetical protein